MMKWQPAVHLFDKVCQLDATTKKVENVQRDQLLEQTANLVDDVLIAVLSVVFMPPPT